MKSMDVAIQNMVDMVEQLISRHVQPAVQTMPAFLLRHDCEQKVRKKKVTDNNALIRQYIVAQTASGAFLLLLETLVQDIQLVEYCAIVHLVNDTSDIKPKRTPEEVKRRENRDPLVAFPCNDEPKRLDKTIAKRIAKRIAKGIAKRAGQVVLGFYMMRLH